jgi:peptidoglycan/LPS O-acetylase OafA/YrhL
MQQTPYSSLNHWRGLAACWVVLFHASNKWNAPESWPLTWLHAVASFGWFGVHLFFVISGYCIAERAARSLEKNEPVWRFLIDRGLRIFPTYWAALAVAIALAIVATVFNHQPLVATSEAHGALPIDTKDWLVQLSLIAPWIQARGYLLVAWTLTCEVSFYVVVAAGLALARSTRIPFLALSIGCLAAVAQSAAILNIPGMVLDLWPEFMSGLLVWQAIHWRPIDPKRSLAAILVIVAIMLSAALFASPGSTLSTSCSFALLLILLHRFDHRLANWKPIRPLGFVGIFSYSLYLIHVPLISPLNNLLHRIMPSAGDYAAAPLVLTLLSLPVAWCFYRFIEAPLEQWRHSLRTPRSSA